MTAAGSDDSRRDTWREDGEKLYGRVGQIPLPLRVVIGANGAYWRDFGSYYSMCVVSSDNDPAEEIASYVPEQEVARLRAEVERLKDERRDALDLHADCHQSWKTLHDDNTRLRDGLRRIAETARWYADNDQRLAHEVDHALCVEVLDTAERSLLSGGQAENTKEQG